MPLTMYESAESRDLKVGPDTTELPVKIVVMGSDDHATVYNAVLIETSPTLFGLVRKDLALKFFGGGLWMKFDAPGSQYKNAPTICCWYLA